MEKKSKFKEFMKDKGFVGAFALAVVALGISGYIAYDSTMNEIKSQEDKTPTSSVTEEVGGEVTGIPKDESTAPESGEDASSDTPANNFVTITAEKMMPVDGEIIGEFSNGELVKSETLGVWKTHDGIDIACELGTSVKSATTGKVKSIKDDALWGICVVIDHEGGYEGHYYGLDKALNIKEGSEVTAGEIIGKTATADAELKMPPHLHFGVKENGEWINPVSFIG